MGITGGSTKLVPNSLYSSLCVNTTDLGFPVRCAYGLMILNSRSDLAGLII